MTRRVAVGDLSAKPWRNGHGATRDLLAAPGGPDDWLVSLANLERDAPFSTFPGADRTFTLVAGGPVRFTFGDGASLDCPPLVPIVFPGDRPLACRLTAGPARALNVIADRGRFRAGVAVMRVADGHRLRLPTGTMALYCAEGQVVAADGSVLAAGEALLDVVEVPAIEAREGSATVVSVGVAAL